MLRHKNKIMKYDSLYCVWFSMWKINHVDTNKMFLFTGKQTDKQLVEEYLYSKYVLLVLY